jgi:hypothetical protein
MFLCATGKQTFVGNQLLSFWRAQQGFLYNSISTIQPKEALSTFLSVHHKGFIKLLLDVECPHQQRWPSADYLYHLHCLLGSGSFFLYLCNTNLENTSCPLEILLQFCCNSALSFYVSCFSFMQG